MSGAHGIRPISGGHQSQAVTTTSASVSWPSTRYVRIRCDVACHYRTGTSGQSAGTSDTYLYADESVLVERENGDDTHLHARTVSGTGTLTVDAVEPTGPR